MIHERTGRFDIALAEAETDVQPGIMADDLREIGGV